MRECDDDVVCVCMYVCVCHGVCVCVFARVIGTITPYDLLEIVQVFFFCTLKLISLSFLFFAFLITSHTCHSVALTNMNNRSVTAQH